MASTPAANHTLSGVLLSPPECPPLLPPTSRSYLCSSAGLKQGKVFAQRCVRRPKGQAADEDPRLLQALRTAYILNGLEGKISCNSSKVRRRPREGGQAGARAVLLLQQGVDLSLRAAILVP
jgi:hypothetical protein